MIAQKSEMIEKAAGIIINSGVQELTIPILAGELNVKQSQLYKQLTKDDDILSMLLLGFETDINEFMTEFARNAETPETELKMKRLKMSKD